MMLGFQCYIFTIPLTSLPKSAFSPPSQKIANTRCYTSLLRIFCSGGLSALHPKKLKIEIIAYSIYTWYISR